MADLAFVAGVAATIAQQQAQSMRMIVFHGLYADGGLINAPPLAPELSHTMPDEDANEMVAQAEAELRRASGRLGTNLAYHVNVFAWTMDDVLRARRDYTTARGAYTAGLTGLIAACDSAENFPRPELFDGIDRVRNLDRICQAAWALYTSAFEAHQQAADRLGFIHPAHGLLRDDDDIPARFDFDFEFALYDLRRCKARCGELDAACREAASPHFRTGNRRDADERAASADEYERFASRDLVIAEEEWARVARRLAGFYLVQATLGFGHPPPAPAVVRPVFAPDHVAAVDDDDPADVAGQIVLLDVPDPYVQLVDDEADRDLRPDEAELAHRHIEQDRYEKDEAQQSSEADHPIPSPSRQPRTKRSREDDDGDTELAPPRKVTRTAGPIASQASQNSRYEVGHIPGSQPQSPPNVRSESGPEHSSLRGIASTASEQNCEALAQNPLWTFAFLPHAVPRTLDEDVDFEGLCREYDT
ncbi:hypothetical protein GE09DRAFT_1059713 [Coniochaeta sp. 2T2.1]|nr:hypothetical protein GE09DRAFT_1059713 [Coniochaeta sp. 2T2.1]